ncbi:Dehydrogenase RED2 [Cladobotryum mycophilum]|uniref:Dehydrogenase RED2 n=1 Tax=Cladobotryum mycophilum TaxID=491253 RepID=A0ABR0SER9_9HYPO
MPMHKGILPREGFCADVVLRLIRTTALNPALLLPLILLGRLTKRGRDLSTLHPNAARRLRFMLYVALVRKVSGWLSDKVRNNWIDDEYDWSKEIVLITGGAGGIGSAMVRLFDEMGTTVIVLDTEPIVFAASSRVHHFACDIRSSEGLAAVAEKVKRQVGHPTVIINNAGIGRGKTILDAEPRDIRLTFEVNTLALFWVTKTFLPRMVAQNHGMIVTMASYASWVTIPNLADYSGSKAAALAFHEGLSAELKTRYNAPKVRTVVVHPGFVKTRLLPGFNQGSPFLAPDQEPESVAEAVVKQVLSGRSGQVIIPGYGGILAAMRAFPDWHSFRARNKLQTIMEKFEPQQPRSDARAPYEEGESQTETIESAVLVSEASDGMVKSS